MFRNKTAWLQVLFTMVFVHLISPANADKVEYSDMDIKQLVELDIYAASVLSAHIHQHGEWMAGYDFKIMPMEGNRDGTKNLSTTEVLSSYMITPLNMDMEMHMFHLMYAPSTDLTLMFMASYVEKEMEHQTRAGSRFTTESSGWGDLHIKANYIFYRQGQNWGENQLGFTLGISLPTGSIDKKDFLPPMGSTQRLPYPMQLGSGSYDFLAGSMYLGLAEKWYWGLQGMATIRSGYNDRHYKLSNKLTLKGWLSYAINDYLSTSVKLNAMSQGNIHGSDPELNPNMVSTANPNLRGKKIVDFAIGAELNIPTGMFSGHDFSVDLSTPIYQNLDGPQLKTDQVLKFAWHRVF